MNPTGTQLKCQATQHKNTVLMTKQEIESHEFELQECKKKEAEASLSSETEKETEESTATEEQEAR